MFEGDERITHIGLTPVDELTVLVSSENVGQTHIAMHDRIGNIEDFHSPAHLLEDAFEFLKATYLDGRYVRRGLQSHALFQICEQLVGMSKQDIHVMIKCSRLPQFLPSSHCSLLKDCHRLDSIFEQVESHDRVRRQLRDWRSASGHYPRIPIRFGGNELREIFAAQV